MEYLQSAFGGLLIGLAAAALLLLNGRIAGISGIIGQVLGNPRQHAWRVAFLAGLVLAGVLWMIMDPAAISQATDAGPAQLATAGVLVGVGTAMANGCTSGHGVCGLARLSRRSLVATVTFIGTAAITVFLITHVLGA